MTYRLSRQADEDIVNLYVEGARLFGMAQAEGYHRELTALFNLLAANPLIARERAEIRPPVRIHPFRSHLVIYLMEKGGDVFILRIRHSHENWWDELL